ncbi:MAG: AI-2E family transporter [Runella slithyformis]|nr:MAG: AI-2E family transporter [Runella slithyformis]TAF25660.1 MAG: AI-2E family transporter [Runella slithyformis]TAF44005.1 MAG: AI-2E family transporter [Runella slithyformis]
MKSEPYSWPYAARLACSLICVSILIYWLYLLADVVMPLLFSIIFAMLLYPAAIWLEKLGLGRIGAILVTLLGFAVVLAGLFFALGYQISSFTDMMPQLTEKLNASIDVLQKWASDQFHISQRRQIAELEKYGKNAAQNSGSVVTTVLSTTTNLLGNMSLVPLYIFFLLYYRDMFTEFFYKVFKGTKKTKINSVLHQIYEVVHSYLSGILIVTLIVGTLNSLGLMALGIQSAIFFGFLAALLLIIPYIGLLIGGLLPLIVALVTKDSPMYAVGVAGVFFVVQFLEGNVITPYVVGSKVSINSLAAIVGLLLGSALWGIGGMVLALPLLAILKVVFDAVPALQPYGYLLGEPNMGKERAVKSAKIHRLEKEVVETISETTQDVKDMIKGKRTT